MQEIRLAEFTSEFKSTPTKVFDWEQVEIKGYDTKIFYHLKNQKKGGFYFYVLEQVSESGHKALKKNPWHPDHCSVDCLVFGEALHDGIKNFSIGNKQTQNLGKNNYPDLELLSLVFKNLRQLEKKNCFTDQ